MTAHASAGTCNGVLAPDLHDAACGPQDLWVSDFLWN